MTRELFTQLVRKELPSLRRFLLAACRGNSCEADDVAQEALMKAYVASRHFEDDGEHTSLSTVAPRFSAWLYRIACNSLIDHQRKQASRGTDIDIDKAGEVAAASRSDDGFAYQDLYSAIDGLNVSERTAVLLFYMEDRPIKEIAAIMDIADGTVKAYLSRGRDHLRTKLSK
ncbi:MAG: sigma-70 family RNA polymerase sigma factor [Prevotella sp.]|nr:sigma-70 family RNA polymerase sigma factor [Prevotella sp.]